MPILLSYRAVEEGKLRVMKDITFRNIYMRSVAAGIGFDVAAAEAYAPHEPIRRVLIDNWILDGVDYPNRQSSPHNQSLESANTFYGDSMGGGAALMVGGPIEDVKISRVTARRLRSKNIPNFLWLRGDRGNGIQIDRSIISYSPSGSEQNGASPYIYQSKNLVPPILEGGAQGFHEWATWMGEPDPRSWFGTPSAPIGVIPCVSDSSTPFFAFQEKNNVRSAAEEAFSCAGKNCDRWNVRLVGKDRQSCAEREALVLDQDLNGIGPFEGLGANAKELLQALGYPRIVPQVVNTAPTEVQIAYASATEAPCFIDASVDPKFSSYMRRIDNGGTGDRFVSLGGYSPGQTGYFRVSCPQTVQFAPVRFTTAQQ
jgi:hypothetical protein